MKLVDAVDMYVLRRQTTGQKFQSPAVALRAFSRRYRNRPLQAITPTEVKQFLDVPQTEPATWRRKYGVLRDFFTYWRCRGKLNTIPMPPGAPKGKQTFVPHIYSRREIRLLLDAASRCQRNVECRISAITLRALLLFLYGTGLRVGEALRLQLADVNLDNSVHPQYEVLQIQTCPVGNGCGSAPSEISGHPGKMESALSASFPVATA